MSENDELVEGANELPEADRPAADEGAGSEPQEAVGETVSAAEEAPVPAEAEQEEPLVPEAASADLEIAEELVRVDLNIASEEELQALPGIGQSLAARIVNYRLEVQPFQDPADITSVQGVSDAMYARIADLVTAGPVDLPPTADLDAVDLEAEYVAAPMEEVEPEADEIEEAFEMELEAAEPEAEEPIAAEQEPEVAKAADRPPRGIEPPLVEVVQARVGWGRLLFVGLLSAFLGAMLALAFLFAVNSTLDFQTAAGRLVQSETVRLEGELDAVNANLADVEGRLQAIQVLDTRLVAVEVSTEQLASDLEALQGEVASLAETVGALRQEFTNLSENLDGMADHVSMLGNRMDDFEQQLASLSQEIEAIYLATERFDTFLDGLRDLLETTGSAGQGASPLGPNPEQTPTLRPMVTVIPLATPTPSP
jgi:competence ComEA-like helix-hairpin-helix protein